MLLALSLLRRRQRQSLASKRVGQVGQVPDERLEDVLVSALLEGGTGNNRAMLRNGQEPPLFRAVGPIDSLTRPLRC